MRRLRPPGGKRHKEEMCLDLLSLNDLKIEAQIDLIETVKEIRARLLTGSLYDHQTAIRSIVANAATEAMDILLTAANNVYGVSAAKIESAASE